MMLLLAAQLRLAHHIELSLLTTSDHVIGARQEHRSGRTQVDIEEVQRLHIGRSEPIDGSQVRVQFDEGAAELPVVLRVEASVPGHDVDVALSVGGRTASGLPDAAHLPVRSRAEYGIQLAERIRIECDDPTLERRSILVRAKGGVDLVVGKRKEWRSRW